MDTSKSWFFPWFYAHQRISCVFKFSNCERHRGYMHDSKQLRKDEKLKRNGAARTDEFRERFERHRTHSNILRTIDGRRKPKKTPGPDLTEKLPSCVRPPTQKGSLLRGGPGGGPRGGRLRDTGRRPRRGPRRSRREGRCQEDDAQK